MPGLSISAMRPLIQRPLQQLRQLSDAGRDLSCLILRHEICCCTSTRLRLEIDVSHGKVIGVADDIGDAAIFLDGPGRWKSGARSLWRCRFRRSRSSVGWRSAATTKTKAPQFGPEGPLRAVGFVQLWYSNAGIAPDGKTKLMRPVASLALSISGRPFDPMRCRWQLLQCLSLDRAYRIFVRCPTEWAADVC